MRRISYLLLLLAVGFMASNSALGQPYAGGGAAQPEHKNYFTGKVTAVDAAAASITFTNKENVSHTYIIPAGIPIQVNGQAGALTAVQVGMFGGVKLADDNKTPVGLMANQPESPKNYFTGKVTAVDAAAASITFTNKDNVSNTYIVPAGIPVQVNGQPGALAGVQVGMYGGVKLAADNKTPVGLKVDLPVAKGNYFTGKVTAVDAAASSITFTNKDNVSNTYTIPAGIPIHVNGQDGTLTGVKVGMYGGVKLAADNKTPQELKVDQPEAAANYVTGQVTAVDAGAGSITLTNKDHQSRTFTIPAGIPVYNSGKPGTLTDARVGEYGAVKLAADGKTPVAVGVNMAPPRENGGKYFTGQVTAIDAAASSITFTNKANQSQTFTIPAGVPVKVDEQPGTLDQVKVGMAGGVKLADDGKTVQGLMIRTAANNAK